MGEHDRRLKETLKLIGKSGIELSPEKCDFRIIRYFERIVLVKGRQPSKEKIEGILKLFAPALVRI